MADESDEALLARHPEAYQAFLDELRAEESEDAHRMLLRPLTPEEEAKMAQFRTEYIATFEARNG